VKPETLTVAAEDIETARDRAMTANPGYVITVEPSTQEWAIHGAAARGLQAFTVTRVRKNRKES
jgi:hypothetical protein